MRLLAASVALSVFALSFFAAPQAALARKPADVFKGQIVLSKWPFPTRFKSDKQFISHMKKVNTTTFEFNDEGEIQVELMAFFKKMEKGREFTARLFETTSGQKFILDFPIYPAQDQNRILASGTTLKRDQILADSKDDLVQPPARQYLLVISRTAKSPVLAETKFVIKQSKAEKEAIQRKLDAQKAAVEKAMAE
ncbi:MAG: hypothetical protein H6702_18720 [Myxococcales bacterium]|nr:hypothetical protein [Myxococcales bacterium]